MTNFEDVLDAESEQERKTATMNLLYERVREKMKSKTGLITQEKAKNEVLEEAEQNYDKAVTELAAKRP